MVLITLAAYSDTFGLGFAMDANTLLRDPRVHAATTENLGLILSNDYWWPSSVDQLYRPVTTASFLLNYAVLGNGADAAGYHWVNFLLHAANVLLVFQLGLLILGKRLPAFFAAALWAVHPIATESVTNIAGRADLLGAMAVLGGLLLYARMGAMTGRRMAFAAAGLFAVSTCGVFSKESAAVLGGLMLLWDLSFSESGWKQGLRCCAAAYGAVAASLVLMVAMRTRVFSEAPWPEMPWADNPLRTASFGAARWTAIKVIGMDLRLLVWPAHLSIDRAYDQIPVAGLADAAAWLAFGIVVSLVGVAVARRGKDRLVFWCAGFFGIALLSG